MDKTQLLYEKAKRLIPRGTQLLSKSPELTAPGLWPAYSAKAKGCEIWDLDEKHYYDVGLHGIGSCLLGFADDDVNNAVKDCIDSGNMSTLNPPEEVELAEKLCAVHSWADKARFTRTGGEAMAVAVRIARATTGKSVVAICGYHGWHDWYLAANLGEDDSLKGHLLPGLTPAGVPTELRGTAFTFTYNNKKQFSEIIKKHGKNLAAVIMEPGRYHDPEQGFLEFIKEEAHKTGALLVFDEITIGFRICFGGLHLKLGINPDIAVFAKSLGNGYPIGAVIGTEKAMQGAEESFISSTYWTERIGPVAALATLKKMEENKLPEHCNKIGAIVKGAWKKYGAKYNLPVIIDDGYPALAHFSFDHQQANTLKTLYIQHMLEEGFLANLAIYVTLAHTREIIEKYCSAIERVFAKIQKAISSGDIESSLKGKAASSGFKRLL